MSEAAQHSFQEPRSCGADEFPAQRLQRVMDKAWLQLEQPGCSQPRCQRPQRNVLAFPIATCECTE